MSAKDFSRSNGLLAVVRTSEPLSEEEKTRLTDWLKIRLNIQNVTLYEIKDGTQTVKPDEK